ncbi:rho-related GTP-binding protein RhoH [Nothobranchius furzeri]|uniref:Rho-related GTP-binding protein RhoH n=3 Tax=Nothobranchiidae TaxID=405002 RepID=A0A8C6LTX4_NOTFU|nr:rho-related GTP-binding protein RhoH [Nothobranchius furzeri]KAF7213004.1 ras-like protein family member H [Nothobranchius furzeri]
MNGMTDLSVKCVLVGDSAVGKTALLVRFTSETFPDSYKPTVFDNTGVEVFMDGVQISLGLWDTAGNENLRQIRPRSYQHADVVLICYSVANPNSLANIQRKWIAEVRENLPKVPVLVVATQTDLREMGVHRGSCITPVEGKRVAHEVHAKGYLECSSLSNRGVQQVFEHAVRTVFNKHKKQERRRMFGINQCKIF